MQNKKLLFCRNQLKIYNDRIMKMRSLLFTTGILICLSSTNVNAQTDNWETRVLRNMENNRTAFKNTFYKDVSASMYVFSIGVPATYLVSGLIQHDQTLKKTALFLTESIAISQLVTFSTKAIVNRERPYVKDPTLTPVIKAGSASFPSGHTSASFSLATSLAIINHKWYVVAPAFAWAGMVGYSRMYLGVHYPSDVLAGAIIGSGSAWLSYKLNKWMHPANKNKLKQAPAL